jgi:hypothetical protein
MSIRREDLARIEDLGRGDVVRVDCAACHHVALLTPAFLLRLGLSPSAKVLDLKSRVRGRGCGVRGLAANDPYGATRVAHIRFDERPLWDPT